MTIYTFTTGPFSTNTYIISCPQTQECALIDAAPESLESTIASIEKHRLKLTKILLTHSHWDHIAEVAALKKKYNPLVVIHEKDRFNLEVPGSDRLPCWIEIEGVKPDLLLKEDDLIDVGSLQFKVIHTPGHTPGGVCFYSEKENLLFSGDTLFKGTIGNLSFPTSVPDLMWGSLKKLAQLPPQTRVYPGHGPATTIGSETWLMDAEELFS